MARPGLRCSGTLAPMIFPVAQEPPRRPVEGRPPGLLTASGIAPDLDVAAARGASSGAVARLPRNRHRARLPTVLEAALRRPGNAGHPASRTHFRLLWPGIAHHPLPPVGRVQRHTVTRP